MTFDQTGEGERVLEGVCTGDVPGRPRKLSAYLRTFSQEGSKPCQSFSPWLVSGLFASPIK